MPKRIIFFLSVGCVAVAVLILFVSILVSSPAYLGENGAVRMGRRFYVGREVLPDHIFYPLTNLSDLIAIDLVGETERPWVELETAQRRLAAAQALYNLDKTRSELVLMTLNKSHIYLLNAGDGLLREDRLTAGELAYFKEIIEQREKVLSSTGAALNDSQRSRVDVIRREEEVLKQQIEGKLAGLMGEGEIVGIAGGAGFEAGIETATKAGISVVREMWR